MDIKEIISEFLKASHFEERVYVRVHGKDYAVKAVEGGKDSEGPYTLIICFPEAN